MLSPRIVASVATVAWLSACGSHPPSSAQPSEAPSPSVTATRPEAEVTQTDEPRAAPEAAPEAPPPLTLTVTKTHERVVLAVQNRTRSQVRFRADVELEAGSERREYRLELDAERPLPPCAELAPGALLELSVTPESRGNHRFALLSCDGAARTESETFTL